MNSEGTIQLRDGRVLAFATWGDPSGRPLLRLHGTPGSRYGRSPDAALYARLGAHVVTFDRPGYGGSSPHRDRTILSVADDAIELVNALGWDRFSVQGGSGGGPHALALAMRAPERIARIGIAASAPPPELIDESEMIEINREGARRSRLGRSSLEELMSGPATQLSTDPAGAIDAAMVDAPDCDRSILARPEVRVVLVEELREAFRPGPIGWFDDAWVLSQPWGFDLSHARGRIWMWHGELDRNSPLSAIRVMAARLRLESFALVPGQGHLCAIGVEETILKTLMD